MVFFSNRRLWYGAGMDPRPIRHFLAAFEAGTFSAAAERLNISQQAISKSILRLETELGVRLFERDGRRLRPTPYADLLVPSARTIASETDRFRASLHDMLGGQEVRLKIGVGPSAAAELVARAVLALTDERPAISMRVIEGVQETMREQLVLGELDLYVALSQADRADPLIREAVLGSVEYIAIAGASHPFASHPKATIAELSETRWIAGSNLGAVEDAIGDSFRKLGLPAVRPEIETTSLTFTLGILDGGKHVAILPEILVRRDLKSGRLVRIELEGAAWFRPLVVGTRVRSPKLAGLMAFAAKLQEEVARL